MANEPSQDKGVIIVPGRLLEKIDQCRDKLSRAEFVEFCVDSLLKQGEVSGIEAEKEAVSPREAKAKDSVSRQEFEEFKEGIKKLQRAYIDLLLALSLEPLSKASAEELKRFKQRMIELLGA